MKEMLLLPECCLWCHGHACDRSARFAEAPAPCDTAEGRPWCWKRVARSCPAWSPGRAGPAPAGRSGGGRRMPSRRGRKRCAALPAATEFARAQRNTEIRNCKQQPTDKSLPPHYCRLETSLILHARTFSLLILLHSLQAGDASKECCLRKIGALLTPSRISSNERVPSVRSRSSARC